MMHHATAVTHNVPDNVQLRIWTSCYRSWCITCGRPVGVGSRFTNRLVRTAFCSIGVDTESTETSEDLVAHKLFCVEGAAQVKLEGEFLRLSVLWRGMHEDHAYENDQNEPQR